MLLKLASLFLFWHTFIQLLLSQDEFYLKSWFYNFHCFMYIISFSLVKDIYILENSSYALIFMSHLK